MKRILIISALVTLFTGLWGSNPNLNSSVASKTPQTIQTHLSDDQSRQVAVLSEHLILNDNFLQRFLDGTGFSTPPEMVSAWKRYPDYRKLLVATRMAAAADPVAGADRMLALLASDLSQRGDPVSNEPQLAQLLSRHANDLERRNVAYARFQSTTSRISTALPAQQLRAVRVLSKFLESGLLGTPQSVMVQYVGISFDQAFDLLETSDSVEHAWVRAWASLPEDRRTASLSTLAVTAAKLNPALRHEDDLVVLLRNNTNNRDDEGPGLGIFGNSRPPSAPSGPAGGGVGYPSAEEVKRSFEKLTRESYADPASQQFETMRTTKKGFGGIIFGNSVVAAPTLPRIKLLRYEAKTATSGALRVVFEGGTERRMEGVSFEEAFVVRDLVFSGAGWKPGNGIGLVGLEWDCENGTKLSELPGHFNAPEERFIRQRVVLNPALRNTAMGWSAIAVDGRPHIPQGASIRLQRRASSLQISASSTAFVSHVFSAMAPPKTTAHAWKVSEVPLTVYLDGQDVRVRRSDGAGEFPEGVRKTAYIEMVNMRSNEGGDNRQYLTDPEFAAEFYQIVPVLIRVFPEYKQINHLASVMALVRLAKQQNATFDTLSEETRPTPTPMYVEFHLDEVKPYSAAECSARK